MAVEARMHAKPALPVKAEDMTINDVDYMLLHDLEDQFSGNKEMISRELGKLVDDELCAVQIYTGTNVVSEKELGEVKDYASKVARTKIFFDRFGVYALQQAKEAMVDDIDKSAPGFRAMAHNLIKRPEDWNNVI